MQDERRKDRAAVRVFPPAVPLAVVLLGIALEELWPLAAGSLLAAPVRYLLGGLIVAGAFLGLGVWSVIVMRRSGESENPWKPTHRIVERGPFRVTRNPMYLQLVLVTVGIAVLLGNLWILILAPLGAWTLQRFAILPEEHYLEQKFGATYLAYKARVRRWL